MATIEALNGKRRRAAKIFANRVDLSKLINNPIHKMYLAGYYAAMEDAKLATQILRQAIAADPSGQLAIYVEISDDFAPIRHSRDFRQLLDQIKIDNSH